MTVRQSLLAILAVGPCYGYQLRAEFDRRTGSTRPLNVGQIYTTLERLERDGLVARGTTDAEGHLYWEITGDGRTEVDRWFAEPVDSTRSGDELVVKVALASTLPGADAASVLRIQRAATIDRLDALERTNLDGGAGGAEEFARLLVHDARVLDARSELRWLEHSAEALAVGRPEPLPLSTAKPRRGRPAKA